MYEPKRCPGCGFRNVWRARFCANCGASIIGDGVTREVRRTTGQTGRWLLILLLLAGAAWAALSSVAPRSRRCGYIPSRSLPRVVTPRPERISDNRVEHRYRAVPYHYRFGPAEATVTPPAGSERSQVMPLCR